MGRILAKNLEFRFLIFLYVTSILYGLYVLGILEKDHEAFTRITYSLGAFCFIFLILYTVRFYDFIEPSQNIQKLSSEIKKEKILGGKDVIEPIIDIIRGSILRFDEKTAVSGLGIIGDKIEDLIAKEEFERKEEKEILDKIFPHLIGVGRFAMSQKNQYSAMTVIENIEKIGKKAIEKELEMVARRAGLSLSIIGNDAMKDGFEIITSRAVLSLFEIGRTAIENEFKATSIIVRFIRVIGNNAKRNQFRTSSADAEMWIEELIRIAEEVGNDKLVSTQKRIVRS